MNKPKSITQLSKEQLEDLCLNLMHTDKVKTEMINQLEEEKEELKVYVTNKLKEFERLINTSPIPSFYQLPYGVCVSFLNKMENGGSNG